MVGLVSACIPACCVAATFNERIAAYTDPANAIVLTEGEAFALPAPEGGASYVNMSAHRFLAIDGNTLTAKNAGIGAFQVKDSSGALVATVPVFVTPADRQIDNIYIFKFGNASKYNWSNPASWVKYGSAVQDGFPNGENDAAFIPIPCTKTFTVTVDGSFSLASLYCSTYVNGPWNYQHSINGGVGDGTSSLTFFGITGKNPVPAKFMLAGQQSSGEIVSYKIGGSSLTERIAFRIGRGTLDVDCGGPTDRVFSESDARSNRIWFNSGVTYDIPSDCTLRFVNGIRRRRTFVMDDQMNNVFHISIAGDVFIGSGTLEFDSCSAILLCDNALRNFTGRIRSQSLNYIRNQNSNRSCILWSGMVDAPEAIGEINGFCDRNFNAANGVGAWGSGNSHGYGDPNKLLGNGLPGLGLIMNGGILQLLGLKKTGSDETFLKRADGKYEGLYRTGALCVGKGFSYIDNSYSGTDGDWVISHFIADSVVHSDPCGTLRVSDAHFIRKMSAIGTYPSETTLGDMSGFYVGYKGLPNYANNIFPIVPWAIGQSDTGNSGEPYKYFWWLGTDANGNVVRNGDRTHIDRNSMQQNQNCYVNGDINLETDKVVNSLILRNRDGNKKMYLGAGRTLTIRSGGLGLEDTKSSIGTREGGMNNGTLIFPEKAFVYATSNDEANPNQIWAKIKAEKGLVSGYCGNLLLGGDQSGIMGELTINNGTLQFGSVDGVDGCQLGVKTIRAIGGNTVIRINKEGVLEDKMVRFECPAGFSPKFKLPNGVVERCYKFYIDGKSIKSGSYGSSESDAVNRDDEHFTGTGQLIVRRDDIGVGFSMVFRP